MNWTSVAEKNPAVNGLYIVTFERKDGTRFVDEDWYTPKDTVGNPQGWLSTWPAAVVAWMERPGTYNG